MKLIKHIFIFTFGIISFVSCANKEPGQVKPDPLPDSETEFFQVDPLFKVVRNSASTRIPVKLADPLTHAARGEYVSVQFVVKSTKNIIGLSIGGEAPALNGAKLEIAQRGFVSFVGIGHPVANRMVPKGLVSTSNEYPDPIMTERNVDVLANQFQPIWLTVKVPIDAAEGVYKGKVNIKYFSGGKSLEQVADFSVKVYPTAIDQGTLKVTNQFTATPELLSYINNGQKPDYYSPRHWELLETVAKFIAPYRQNVIYFYAKDLAMITHNVSTQQYTFNFDRLDQWINIFQRQGIGQMLQGGILAIPKEGDPSQYYFWVPLSSSQNPNNVTLVHLPLSDSRTINFLEQFLPALRQHLINKGWYDKYIQHIADEPPHEMKPAYNHLLAEVRRIVPDMKIIEAVMDNTSNVIADLDVWVPKLDDLEANYERFYLPRKQAGADLWFYVCNEPVGKWANRYIEQELIYTRLLHWINFKYDFPGFLHWALADWKALDPTGTDIAKIFRDPSASWIPAGDGNIIYPGGNNKLYSSIRFEAMREGIQDYELLKKLQKVNPALAKEIVDYVIKGFGSYNTNILDFRQTRIRILNALSGQ